LDDASWAALNAKTSEYTPTLSLIPQSRPGLQRLRCDCSDLDCSDCAIPTWTAASFLNPDLDCSELWTS